MTPSLPPIQLSTPTNSASGDISAPNTVYFGGFGSGSGGGGLASLANSWPLMAAAAVVLIAVLKRKH